MKNSKASRSVKTMIVTISQMNFKKIYKPYEFFALYFEASNINAFGSGYQHDSPANYFCYSHDSRADYICYLHDRTMHGWKENSKCYLKSIC